MIISDSNVSMSSQRSYTRRTQHRQTVFMWTDKTRQKTMSMRSSIDSFSSRESYGSYNCPSYNRFGQLNNESDASGNVSQKNRDDFSGISTGSASVSGTSADNFKADRDTVCVTLMRLIEMLRNSRFKMNVSDSAHWKGLRGGIQDSPVLSLTSSVSPAVWNRVTHDSYSFEERESTSFSSTGTVVTADGRSISFDVTMKMSREFKQTFDLEYFDRFQQVLTDPLVINLDSKPASVSDKTFFFDIDCDGKKEEIAELAPGSGYLALDLNNDGIINDGSELFGPATGNGFDELARYDSDGNGWIDEADEIFGRLKVWTKDEHGDMVLLSLKEADVGAICLKSSKTDFSLKQDGQLRGMVRSTGIYLKESGGSGTVQQVDF